MDYNNLLLSVITLSKEAGSKILEIYSSKNKRIDVELKDDLSPLTIADKTSNKIILKKLKELTPNIPILSEEEKKELGALKNKTGFEVLAFGFELN